MFTIDQVVFLFELFLILSLVLLINAFLKIGIRSVVQIKNKLRQKKMEQFYQILKNSGVCLYYNINSNVVAICTEKAFQDGLAKHYKKVKQSEISGWDKVVCYADPTFVFAPNNGAMRPAYTGFKKEADNILAEKMNQITGPTGKRSTKEFEYLLSAILIRDTRLFVPCQSEVSQLGYQATGLQQFKNVVRES